MKEVKAHVTLTNGESFFAKLYVNDDERLQDVLNDERRYLPVNRHYQSRGRGNEDVWRLTLLNKEFIMSLEER